MKCLFNRRKAPPVNHETAEAVQAPPMTDLAAERAVIGAMLMSDDAISEICDLVGVGDFYHFAHALIFEAIMERFNA
ncbi:hypothetical protein ADL26_07880, partial [Thermoactinomyces vulgaris]